MSTNKRILVYDDNCPLCTAYTSAFVKTGLLDENGRKNFNNLQPETVALLDIDRSRNEIPLIDIETKKVWYGTDALTEILSKKMPFIEKLYSIKPLQWLIKKLYKLISYNRRVIVATKQPEGNFDCTPDFNTRYRVAFLFLFLCFNTWMLFPFHQFIITNSLFKATGMQKFLWLHNLVVFSNILIAIKLGKKDGLEYIGQVNMLALICILTGLPLILLNKYLLSAYPMFTNIYLLSIGALFIREYLRRMSFAGMIKKYPALIFLNGLTLGALVLYLIY